MAKEYLPTSREKDGVPLRSLLVFVVFGFSLFFVRHSLPCSFLVSNFVIHL